MSAFRRLTAFAMFGVFSCHTGFAGAGDAAVEESARVAASAANAQFQKSPPNDRVIKSERAYAQGKAVVYEYVLAIRPNVTETELAVWRSGTRGEVVPVACSVLRKDEFFKKGLHFRYRYLDRSGRVLDDFLVNRAACGTQIQSQE